MLGGMLCGDPQLHRCTPHGTDPKSNGAARNAEPVLAEIGLLGLSFLNNVKVVRV